MINKILKYILTFIPSLIAAVALFAALIPANYEKLDTEITEQVERIAALEKAYASGEIAPVDESAIYAGNLKADLEAGIKFNELSFLGTHNSYQTTSVPEYKKLFKHLSNITFGLVPENSGDFARETLTEQLNNGLRSFEIDIETFERDGEISFTCMHIPTFDMRTSCYDFALAMKEIAMWSDNNPDHLPITVIIEPKRVFIPLEDMKFFNLDYAKELDNVLREALGDRLFTPADMLRDYASFGAMRAADDWCRVEDMLGKVVVMLHETTVTENYIAIDPSIKTQAMFPMLREEDIERDCASIILANKPDELVEIKDEIKSKKIMVRTRADKFNDISEERRELAFKSEANIISTDYPVRPGMTADSYYVSFGGSTTAKGNK